MVNSITELAHLSMMCSQETGLSNKGSFYSFWNHVRTNDFGEGRHIYNYLYAMPPMENQHEKLGSAFAAPFVLIRLLTPRNKKYHDAGKAYEPYDKLVRPLPDTTGIRQ